MQKILVFILFSIAIISCNNDSGIEPTPTPDISLNFGKLKLGDQMQFMLFETTCSDFNGGLQFTGDTLNWEVTRLENGEATLTEQFTPNSPLAENEKYDNQISFTDDYILMPDRFQSNLFFFYGNDTLHVDPAPTVTLTQENCFFKLGEDNFRGDEIAFSEDVTIQDYSFKDMTIVSCVPGSVGEAYIVYKNGAVYAIFSRDFFSEQVRGWVAIEN
ncbi:MAG: hypothetical protein AAGK97_02810 [Bacteroidota bacterium]